MSGRLLPPPGAPGMPLPARLPHILALMFCFPSPLTASLAHFAGVVQILHVPFCGGGVAEVLCQETYYWKGVGTDSYLEGRVGPGGSQGCGPGWEAGEGGGEGRAGRKPGAL